MNSFYRDSERVLRIARDSGLHLLEYYALYNLGETDYVIGSLQEGTQHTLRAIDLATRMWGADALETSGRELLLARIKLYGGAKAEARGLTDTLRRRMAIARDAGKQEALFTPSDQ